MKNANAVQVSMLAVAVAAALALVACGGPDQQDEEALADEQDVTSAFTYHCHPVHGHGPPRWFACGSPRRRPG